MARWEPNARERLSKAAMELFFERGYGRTTVEDIAERAGLTERTFFRYFADKREVFFWGSNALEQRIVAAIAGEPAEVSAFDAVASALAATGEFFDQRRAFAKQRQALVTAHPELHERELIKLASLAAAIAECLRRRGVAEATASLAAEVGIAVFKIGFERWLGDTRHRRFAHHVRAARAALETL